jgi:hypothetical protein
MEVLSFIFLEGLRKTTNPVRKTYVPGKIRTEHVQNTRLERYRYTNPLDTDTYILVPATEHGYFVAS